MEEKENDKKSEARETSESEGHEEVSVEETAAEIEKKAEYDVGEISNTSDQIEEKVNSAEKSEGVNEIKKQNKEIKNEAEKEKEDFDGKIGEIVETSFLESECGDVERESELDLESDMRKRQEIWNSKDKKEKEEEIEKAETLFKAELQTNPELQITEEMLKDKEKLTCVIKEIQENNKEMMKRREEVIGEVMERLEKGEDISEGLSLVDRKEYMAFFSQAKSIIDGNLNIEKLKYISQAGEKNSGDLFDSHEMRIMIMEELGKMMEYLENMEKIIEKEEEEAKEEVIGLIDRIKNICKENPRLCKALRDAGIIAAVAILAGMFGIPFVVKYGPTILAMYLGYRILKNKRVQKALIMTGKGIVGGLLGGAFVLASYLTKGENWDRGAEWVTGMRVPSFARSVPDK